MEHDAEDSNGSKKENNPFEANERCDAVEDYIIDYILEIIFNNIQ